MIHRVPLPVRFHEQPSSKLTPFFRVVLRPPCAPESMLEGDERDVERLIDLRAAASDDMQH